jgi:type IV pilus assembly protein PilM
MSRLVGVDIGSTAVRVAEVQGVDADGFALVSRMGVCPLPVGAVAAGRVRSPREVSVALVRALREAGVSRQGFVLGLASPEVALTTMVFPSSVRAAERDGAVRSMGRSISATFSLESSVLATYLAGTTPSADGLTMSTVGVAAALDEDIAALKNVCELARCSPRSIDLTGAALLRALTRVNPLATEVGTIVDIGATKVTVATRQGMYLRSLRTTAGAGDDITRAIAGVSRDSFESAEQQKLTMRLPRDRVAGYDRRATSYGLDDESQHEEARSWTPVELSFSASADLLVDAIAQSVEADAANFASMTQGVTICGGTALLRGLKDRLQQRLGVPVSIARPWAEIERSKRNAPYFKEGKPDPRLLLTMSAAIGLALWKEPA